MHLREGTSPQKSSRMARVVKGSHRAVATYPCVYARMECTIPAFVFPAEAGPHLPTSEGWRNELA